MSENITHTGPSKSKRSASVIAKETTVVARITEPEFTTIAARHPTVWRHKQSDTPRDNVVFELGLFMGDVGPDRAFVVKPRGVALKIPTDLLGMKSLEYDASDPAELTTALAPVCNEIRKRVASLGMK